MKRFLYLVTIIFVFLLPAVVKADADTFRYVTDTELLSEVSKRGLNTSLEPLQIVEHEKSSRDNTELTSWFSKQFKYQSNLLIFKMNLTDITHTDKKNLLVLLNSVPESKKTRYQKGYIKYLTKTISKGDLPEQAQKLNRISYIILGVLIVLVLTPITYETIAKEVRIRRVYKRFK